MSVPSALRHVARRHAVCLIAALAAAGSCVLVTPDAGYGDYVEWRTMACLLSMMAVVAGVQRAGLLDALAGLVVGRLHTRRRLVIGLVWATAAAAMLVTNDVALLTLLPLTFAALRQTGNQRHLPLVFVLQTAAANLGGMLTPFGSPQNLFLFSYFHMGAGEFVAVMAVPFAVSMAAITGLCLLAGDAPTGDVQAGRRVTPWPAAGYAVPLVAATFVVLRVVPAWAGLFIAAAAFAVDRRALRDLDVGLLVTFVCFFVFAGNLARSPQIADLLTSLAGSEPLLAGALVSQVISNVPAAILLAPFTDAHLQLLVGVNVGGVGTLIGSLASLIALAQVRALDPGRVRAFLGWFAAINAGLLILLLAVMQAAFAAGL